MTWVHRNLSVSALAIMAVVCGAVQSDAGTGRRWSSADLTRLSDVILTGRVEGQRSGWDPAVGAIYTYVTIGVDDVLKGPVSRSRVTIKQLGGIAGDIGLDVMDQPTFTTGEAVLLFLEARPRDRSLYTAGLSQGKWTLDRGLRGGRARRGADTLGVESLRVAAADHAGVPLAVETDPVATASQPFALMSTAYRYSFFPPVDVQAGGQPGLPGGGFVEIQTALARWNNAGSAFRYTGGSSAGPPRCANQFLGSYRVTISFLDPCGEISNSGATLAIGGSYFSTTASTTVNGRVFRLALEGFVINNDSDVALQFLRSSSCFHNIELHELGHVLGLGHSVDTTAIMFPSLSSECLASPSGLALDDVNGIQFIYPLSGPAPLPNDGPPGQATVTRAFDSSELLTVEWLAGPGAPPTSHRLDFIVAASGQVISVPVGAATRADIPIPAGTRGLFDVRVTAFNQITAGPTSLPFAFGIGQDIGCGGPPGMPNVSGVFAGGTAAVGWPAVPGALSYVLQAGTTVGAANLVPPTNLGSSTGASASDLPPDFSAWVRVVAVNQCGQSEPADFLLQAQQ